MKNFEPSFASIATLAAPRLSLLLLLLIVGVLPRVGAAPATPPPPPPAATTPNAAAAPPAATEPPVQLAEFTVSAGSIDRYRAADAVSAVRVRAPLIDTASSITVLTRDLLDDLVPSRIFDATRYVAGVQDGRGMQFQDRMILRGFESNGQRTVDNFLQPADADNIDEAVIDRIEVAKGPNAILSPSGAPGGSINVLTKSPGFTPRRSITALLGSYDAQKLTLDMTGPFGSADQFAYRLIGSYQESRRYWSEDADIRGKVLAPMFAYRISDKTQLSVKLVAAEHWIFREPLLIIDSAVNADTDEPFLAPGLKEKGLNGIQPWSHVGTHSADLFVQLTSSLSPNISLRFAANGRYYFEDSDQEFLSTPSLTNRYNPTTGELTQDHTWALNPATNTYVATLSPFFNPTAIPVRGDIQATRRQTANVQTDLAGNYRFEHISSLSIGGLAYSRQTANGHTQNGTLPPVDLTRPDVRVYPTYPDALASDNENSFTNWQLYVNQRFGFLNERLFISGGVLRFETKTTARNVLANTAPSILDDGKNMWSANVLGKVLPNVALYYSYSTNSSPVIANNVPLWRDGVQDEVGFKTEFFNQRLSVNGSFFKIEQTNVTVPNPDRQTNPTAPEQLVSDFGNEGFEIEVMGGLTSNISMILSYAHLKMRDSLGRRVRAVADDTVGALFNFHVKEGGLTGLSLYLGGTYTGRRAGDTPINFTPLGVVGKTSFFLKPAYATTVGAAYRFKDKFAVRLNVDNVLDDNGYIAIAGGRVSGTGITTAPGINVKLSTTVEF